MYHDINSRSNMNSLVAAAVVGESDDGRPMKKKRGQYLTQSIQLQEVTSSSCLCGKQQNLGEESPCCENRFDGWHTDC